MTQTGDGAITGDGGRCRDPGLTFFSTSSGGACEIFPCMGIVSQCHRYKQHYFRTHNTLPQLLWENKSVRVGQVDQPLRQDTNSTNFTEATRLALEMQHKSIPSASPYPATNSVHQTPTQFSFESRPPSMLPAVRPLLRCVPVVTSCLFSAAVD